MQASTKKSPRHPGRWATVCALLAMALAAAPALAADPVPAPAAQTAQPPSKFKAKKLDRAEIDALLSKPDTVVFLDVRRPDELTKIGGFPVYLSIQSKDLENNLAFIPKDRTIVTVSNHAARAGAAADLLASKGFHVAGAVGVENYQEQGGVLTKIVPPPAQPATASKP